MGVTELILLIFGGVVFTVSFLIPAGRQGNSEKTGTDSKEQIQEIIEREIEQAKTQISDIVDETIHYSMEKTERSMERLTNEKMMAVNEYSDTVLEQINKNHKEAVFLYDMLNDKHENLKTTVSQAVKTAAEVKQTVKDAEITARETKAQAEEIKENLNVSLAASAPEEEFVPIHPARVELAVAPEEAGPEAPRKKPGRKQAEPAAAQEPVKAKKTGRTKKAVKVDLSMASSRQNDSINNNERILELHKAGKSNMAIARELSLGIGEVKLVIDLFEGI